MVKNEGVPVIIEWHKFAVGSSFYIPAIRRQELAEQVVESAKVRGMKVRYRFTLEGTTMGVRFWRTK